MADIDEMQLDALSETFNVSLNRAAAAFADLLGEEIELTIPTVEVLDGSNLLTRLPGSGEQMYGISQVFDMRGVFRTKAILVFPERSSRDIVRTMLGEAHQLEQITEIEQDALAEVGNIIINACMSSLADMFGATIEGTLPHLLLGTTSALLKGDLNHSETLVARIGMRVASRDLSGFMLFMMDRDSAHGFTRQVARAFGI